MATVSSSGCIEEKDSEELSDNYSNDSQNFDDNQDYGNSDNLDNTKDSDNDGYTDDMKQRLYNGMPQRAYTEAKAKQKKIVERPKPTFRIDSIFSALYWLISTSSSCG